MVVEMLSRLGYQVLEAGDGATAHVALERTPSVHLLLSDVRLPGGRSGPDIVEEAQNHYPDLKALFMSGDTGLRMFRQGQLPEGIELLQKPFTKHDLAQKVRAALDK